MSDWMMLAGGLSLIAAAAIFARAAVHAAHFEKCRSRRKH